MKKHLLSLILGTTLCLAGCTQQTNTPEMHIGALKGPTAMGMIQMIDTPEESTAFTILPSPDQITPQLAKGELTLAAVPANLASVLYNTTEKSVQVLAINTLGVLYIVENGDSITSIEDLKGKTLYASGKGSTPEYALNYLLEKNNLLDDVTIEWKSEHTECVVALQKDPKGVALLPEPFVTTASLKSDTIRTALDLNTEWEKAGATGDLITGVLVGNRTFIEENPAAVDAFLDDYEASTRFVLENTEESAKLIGAHDIIPENIAALALPKCHITYIEGDAMQEALSGYLTVLFDQNPKAVGGALPEDDFYYVP